MPAAVLAAVALAVAFAVPAIAQPDVTDARAGASAPTSGDDLGTLLDPKASSAARTAAARRLMSSADPDARPRLETVLRSVPAVTPTSPSPRADASPPAPDGRTVLLAVIRDLPSAPPWLAADLSTLAKSDASTLELRLDAARALSSVRTRDSMRALINLAADPQSPAPLANTCYQSLSRLTGHDEFGTDLRSWSLWFTQVEWLPEAEWRRVLMESLAAQASRAAQERDSAVGRIIDAARAELQNAPGVDERSRVIERTIRDPLPAVRAFGFSAALQELANTRPLDQRVGQAALDALKSDRTDTRRAAAELLGVLATPAFAEPLGESLRYESDASVAALLIRVLSRWPTETLRPALLRWLEYGEPTRTPAIDALAALLERAGLNDPIERDRVLTAVKQSPIDRLSPGGVRLLFGLGSGEDRQRVLDLLASAEPARRPVLGETLASDARATEAIVRLAEADPSLFNAAMKALMNFQANGAGYQAALALPAPEADVRRRLLTQFAARLPAGELLAVARNESNLDLREAILSRLTSEPLRTAFDQHTHAGLPRYSQHPSVVAGLLLLCQTRLELNQPAAALQALDALLPEQRTGDGDGAAALRVEALVCLGKIAEAEAVQTGPNGWISGLARSIDQPHAARALASIERRFGPTLAPEDSVRLAELRERIGTFVGPRGVR